MRSSLPCQRQGRWTSTSVGCRACRSVGAVPLIVDVERSTFAPQTHKPRRAVHGRKLFGSVSGEPPRNRTENPQIKSLLLCQLS